MRQQEIVNVVNRDLDAFFERLYYVAGSGNADHGETHLRRLSEVEKVVQKRLLAATYIHRGTSSLLRRTIGSQSNYNVIIGKHGRQLNDYENNVLIGDKTSAHAF